MIPFPPQLTELLSETSTTFLHQSAGCISFCDHFACDSVDRGFDRILPHIAVVSDGYHRSSPIAVPSDLEIADARYSSTCG